MGRGGDSVFRFFLESSRAAIPMMNHQQPMLKTMAKMVMEVSGLIPLLWIDATLTAAWQVAGDSVGGAFRERSKAAVLTAFERGCGMAYADELRGE